MNKGGTIENCHNTNGTVFGGQSVGGVCGDNNGTIQKSYNTGEVSGENLVGGVCGLNESNSTVKLCYNTGGVSGNMNNVGGVCGANIGTLENSYNTGTVSGGNFVGGVCGDNNSTVKGCYSKFSGLGVCGKKSNGGAVENCYYLSETSGADHPYGGTSKTEAEFQKGAVAYQMQADLGETAEQVWGQTIGTNASPVLAWQTDYQPVYHPSKTSPCNGGYSNSDIGTLEHKYADGKCIYCGESEPPKKIGDYYQITNAEDLKWFADKVNSGDSTIKAQLTKDITLNNDVLTNGKLNTGASDNFTPWAPIGSDANDKRFTGEFDGQGYTIHGLYINGNTDNVGLFGCVGTGGKVINVTVADSYVSGNQYVGGICGQNMGGTLQNCHNTGTVSGKNFVGGVCGNNDNRSTLKECYNEGTVEGAGDNVGGVCGQNNATLENSYNTGDVSGINFVGGVCGRNYNSGKVNVCYNTGEVTGTNKVGSVCGYNYGGTVRNCYYLERTSEKAVGAGSGESNCKFKTKLQFQNGDVAFWLQKSFSSSAKQVWGQNIGTDKTPVLSSETQYKVYETLISSPCKGYANQEGVSRDLHTYEKGVCFYCGECEQPKEATTDGYTYYEIHNQGQLRWFAAEVNSGKSDINARLMESFAMDDTEWTPIGKENQPFKGTFDGQGNTITGLTCTNPRADYVGLVGYAVDATIQNVTVKDSSLNGKDYIGAVCGRIEDGTITGCTTSGGAVSGRNDIGGIVGEAYNATVQRCFNSGEVTGSDSIGGIAGQAYNAAVQDCGNTGAVIKTGNGGNYGGIVGVTYETSPIKNCYNAYRDMKYPIYASAEKKDNLSNCYYPVSSSSLYYEGTTAKTEAQFASGEVAYLLQKPWDDAAAAANTTAEQVWGQNLTEGSKQPFPVLNGEKVYQSTTCPTDYSNTQTDKPHVFENGYCKNCGAPNIAYTVTIPASVELGSKATIEAKDVTMPDGKKLNVKVANGSKFEVALKNGTETVETCTYTVTDVTDEDTKKEVHPSDTVLTADNNSSDTSVILQFNAPTTTYSGTYEGTVTFTVGVE